MSRECILFFLLTFSETIGVIYVVHLFLNVLPIFLTVVLLAVSHSLSFFFTLSFIALFLAIFKKILNGVVKYVSFWTEEWNLIAKDTEQGGFLDLNRCRKHAHFRIKTKLKDSIDLRNLSYVNFIIIHALSLLKAQSFRHTQECVSYQKIFYYQKDIEKVQDKTKLYQKRKNVEIL